MKSIGIICEFNPLHNGHIYFIEKIREMYPDYVVILVLNGYFLERGEVSVLSKEDKTFLSLKYGVDIVLELPVLFGTQSADTFAEKSVEILNNLSVEKIIFGSECDNVASLEKIAKKQLLDKTYDEDVKALLKTGINYPTALAKALKLTDFSFTPNDLLGISYIKAILKNEFFITYETIKRTNGFHDNLLDDSIVSASNIREKLMLGSSIDKYLPKDVSTSINNIDKLKLFELLKIKILTDNQINLYLDVDEGIENRLYEMVKETYSLDEFIKKVKNKRFTYNKINRMLVHILLGITKEDAKEKIAYTKILGFNKLGQSYIKSMKDKTIYPLAADKNSKVYSLEEKAALIYEMLCDKKVYQFEKSNKPVKFD